MLEFVDYISNLPDYIISLVKKIEFFIDDQKIKFKDILKTNIELGKHHFFNGRISDALFRFRMAHLLFDTHNKEINYWAGCCYFFKGKYEEAIAYLEEGKEYDEYGLLEFIKKVDKASSVPKDLWDLIRRVNIANTEHEYQFKTISGQNIDLPLEFTKFCMDKIENIKNDANILDYGAGYGFIGTMIDSLVSPKYKISAIENLDIFNDYLINITGDRGNIYDKIENISPCNAAKNLSPNHYDIITSFDSITFTKDLESLLKDFYKAIKKKGHLLLLLPLEEKTDWSKNERSFVFSENEVKNKLKLAEFDIVAIKKWKLKGKKSFIAFVCSK